MSIKLMIDTCADLTSEDLDSSVIIMPIPVYIDGKEYLPFINLSNEEFYKKQKEANELPKTSQAPLIEIYKSFKKEIENGNEIIAIFMASKMSGTFSSALLARTQLAEEIGEKVNNMIKIVDSENVTYPLAALCIEAYKMVKEQKMTLEEVYQRMMYLVSRIKMRAFIQDLTYLKKGGRISGTTAALAGLFGIKPIIKVENGAIETVSKERGLPNAMKKICALANEQDIDYSLPCYIGYTYESKKAQLLLEHVEKCTKIKVARTISIGPTVGTHTGPGCTGLCWFIK